MPLEPTRLKSLPPVLRPREKLIARGASALTNTELVALLLGSGIKNYNVLSIANRLLKRLGKTGFSGITWEELDHEKGIGKARACIILAALELGRRLFLKEDEGVYCIDGPESVYRLTRDLSSHKKEHFVALYLNAKNQVLKRETITIGSLFSNMVHPREVFGPALEVSAAAVVLVHNHPSGDPEPSPEDRALTSRLVAAGQLMGIEVLDHLVIGRKSYVSFEERKWM